MRIGNRIVDAGALLAVGIIFSSATVTVAHAASVCESISGNLVSNCGFEADPGGTAVPTGWAVTADDLTGYTLGVAAHSGTFGYFLDQARRTDPLVLSQNIATIAGDTYELTFWTTKGEEAGDTLAVYFGAPVPLYSQTGSSIGSDTFVQHVFDVFVTSTSIDLAFSAFSHSSDPVKLDDISVVDVTPPPPTTPIPAALPLFASGAGMLGILGWRKRRKAVSVAA